MNESLPPNNDSKKKVAHPILFVAAMALFVLVVSNIISSDRPRIRPVGNEAAVQATGSSSYSVIAIEERDVRCGIFSFLRPRCWGNNDSGSDSQPISSNPNEPISSGGDSQPEQSFVVLTEDGGHVDWLEKKNLIAFDRIGSDGYFDLWTMDSQGQNQTCLTCNMTQFAKHTGQPAWHPDGQYLAFQAQKSGFPKAVDNKAVPGAGALNDLWIMRIADSQVWKIRNTSESLFGGEGVLHPHFSHDGKKLLWAERIGGGASSFGAWELKIADFAIERGVPSLNNVETLRSTSKGSFYESHGFSPDDRTIIYSSDENNGLDIYTMDLRTRVVKQLTNSRAVWDEHAHYSPQGDKILWVSSQDVTFTVNPFVLQTDFWVMNTDGSNKRRVTFMQDPNDSTHRSGFLVPADSSWSADGKSFIGLVITGHPDTDRRGSGFIAKIRIPQ